MRTRDRLLPSLVDRLTDDDPSVRRPEADRFVFDLARYRAAVMRDLEWLLNTNAPLAPDEAEGLPLVAASTVNYGIPPLAGGTLTRKDTRLLERELRQSITRFEPRILPDSLVVRVISDEKAQTNRAITFHVEGQLWSQPVPEPIYLKTELDLETGEVIVADLDPGRRR